MAAGLGKAFCSGRRAGDFRLISSSLPQWGETSVPDRYLGKRTDSVLENATIETGRLVRTGQASAQSMTAGTFKTALCSRMSIFSGDCESNATIDVRVIPQFNNPTLPDPLGGAEKDVANDAGAGVCIDQQARVRGVQRFAPSNI